LSDRREEFGMRLAAYLGGDMDAELRAAFEAEVLADESKAELLAATVNLDTAVRESMMTPGQAPSGRRLRWRNWKIVGPLAAAAVLLLVFWPGGLVMDGPDRTPVMRGGQELVQGLSPRGEHSAPVTRFVWTRHRGAEQYRLELLDLDGRLWHTVLVADTILAVGDPGFPSVADGPLTWRVVPLLPGGREGLASAPVRATSG